MELLCLNGYKGRHGNTPLLTEILVSSFSGQYSGFSPNDLQVTGRIRDQGVHHTQTTRSLEGMNRELRKTASATTDIPEPDFETSTFSQKGALTTTEGRSRSAISGLQPKDNPHKANEDMPGGRADEVIVKRKELK